MEYKAGKNAAAFSTLHQIVWLTMSAFLGKQHSMAAVLDVTGARLASTALLCNLHSSVLSSSWDSPSSSSGKKRELTAFIQAIYTFLLHPLFLASILVLISQDFGTVNLGMQCGQVVPNKHTA